jgi:hypothetical protein
MIRLSLVLAAVALLALVVLATTSYRSQRLAQLGPRLQRVPEWTRVCWHPNPPPYRGMYTMPCARLMGWVLYRSDHDPDGDGDRHLLVLAGWHLVNVKVPVDVKAASLPGVGSRVTTAGQLGRDRHHLPEVRADWLRG